MARPLTVSRHLRLLDKRGGIRPEAEYRPSLRVEDVGSRGKSFEWLDSASGRHMQLLSTIERNAVLLLRWCSDLADLQEQVALDHDRTRAIAAELGVRHPRLHNESLVMTTDLVASFKVGRKLVVQPVYCKPSEMLEDFRTLEKLQIELEYWRQQGTALAIVTEHELSETVVKNLLWFDQATDKTQRFEMPRDVRARAEQVLLSTLAEALDRRLDQVCLQVDRDLSVPEGSCVSLVGLLLAERRWRVDLGLPLAPWLPLPRVTAETSKASAA